MAAAQRAWNDSHRRAGWSGGWKWSSSGMGALRGRTRTSSLEALDPGGAVGQLEQVAVGEGVGELLLVRHQQDAPQLAWEKPGLAAPGSCRGTIRGTIHEHGIGKSPHMAKPSKPWFRASKNAWYCTIAGRKV